MGGRKSERLKWVLNVFLYFFSTFIYAQVEISGFVKDSTNVNGVFANVVLRSIIDDTIQAYAITNNDGSYSLKTVAIGKFNLDFSAMSYKTKQIPLTIKGTERKINIDVSLISQSVKLNEVIIEANKPITKL